MHRLNFSKIHSGIIEESLGTSDVTYTHTHIHTYESECYGLPALCAEMVNNYEQMHLCNGMSK